MSKAFINESTLTAIGDAIRAKTGKTDLIAPGDMPTEIENIPTGGDIPEEAFLLTGNCTYRFAYGGWDWFLKDYGNRITTENIGVGNNMFTTSKITTIPFDLNFDNSKYYDYAYMFGVCNDLVEFQGTLNNMYPENLNCLFQNCYALREVPKFKNFNPARLRSHNYANTSSIFNSCRSLRTVDLDTLKLFINPLATSIYYGLYMNMFSYCVCLEHVTLPVVQAEYTQNAFNSTFTECNRLSSLTFETNEDGSPIVVNWKNQVLTLNTYIGYVSSPYQIINTGTITKDKEVVDDASYQALKNDPDWFTCKSAYSRYNHDSAVETINSLPDVSASGGVNTIKFNSTSGSATDGGAIGNLTEEEIAVAAAKGWTVTLS